MATPMLLMAAQKTNAPAETKPEPTKSRPSRSKSAPKTPTHKKPPQRGLGVAQLERLRLQERWKKMTEMPPPPPPPSLPIHGHHFQPHSPLLLDPTFANIPLHFSAAAGYAGASPLGDCTGGGGLVFQGMGNIGGFVGGVGGFTVVEPYSHGGGAVDPRVLIGNNGEEDLRELSSIPKMPMPCVSDRCDICLKKKRVNISTELTAAAAAAASTINTNSFDFLGLGTNSAVRGGGGINQGGAEIKQIHRKLGGNGGGGGESLLMEYEFFPGKNGRGTEFKELEMPKEEEEFSFAEEAADHGEASCITTTYTAIVNNGSSSSSSSAVDLSLKLSF